MRKARNNQKARNKQNQMSEEEKARATREALDRLKAPWMRKKAMFYEALADTIFEIIQQQEADNDRQWFVENPGFKCFERPFLPSDCECCEQAYNYAMGGTNEVFPVRTIVTLINERQMIREFELA